MARKDAEHRYEVLVSFSGLDKGDRFSGDADDWANAHVASGYLRDVTEEPGAGRAQGEQAPEASEETVREAHDAGEVGQG